MDSIFTSNSGRELKGDEKYSEVDWPRQVLVVIMLSSAASAQLRSVLCGG